MKYQNGFWLLRTFLDYTFRKENVSLCFLVSNKYYFYAFLSLFQFIKISISIRKKYNLKKYLTTRNFPNFENFEKDLSNCSLKNWPFIFFLVVLLLFDITGYILIDFGYLKIISFHSVVYSCRNQWLSKVRYAIQLTV
jgi:hypothetical protein